MEKGIASTKNAIVTPKNANVRGENAITSPKNRNANSI